MFLDPTGSTSIPFTTDAAGIATIDLDVPGQIYLAGTEVVLQALVGGTDVSNAQLAVVGF